MVEQKWWHPSAEPPTDVALQIGNEYMVKAVRRGGMGLVLLCETRDGERVAIKRLSAELAAADHIRKAFLREAYLWILLGEHPNITRAFGALNPDPESPMVVTEHIRDSLRDVQQFVPSPSKAVTMLSDVIFALRYARVELPGFIHADLKPENILVTQDRRAKVTDFGLSKAIVAAPNSSLPEAVITVSTTGFAGTPLYMSPEQVRGQVLPESDVYSFGCILYELLMGQYPYGQPSSASDCMLRHLVSAPGPMDGNAAIPHSLKQLTYACLEKRAGDRPTLDDVLDDFRKAGEALGVDIGDEPVVTRSAEAVGNAALGLLQSGYEETALELLDTVHREDLTEEMRPVHDLIRVRALVHLGRKTNEVISELEAQLYPAEGEGSGVKVDANMRMQLLVVYGMALANIGGTSNLIKAARSLLRGD